MLNSRLSLEEQVAPLSFAHQRGNVVAASHDRAAFVEDRQHVAQPPALAALARDFRGVHCVDPRLGFRKRQPGESVEQVVPVVRPRLYMAGLENMDFVVRVGRRGRDEADRFSAFALQIFFLQRKY
jgi:hypothetical protein